MTSDNSDDNARRFRLVLIASVVVGALLALACCICGVKEMWELGVDFYTPFSLLKVIATGGICVIVIVGLVIVAIISQLKDG